MDPKPCDSMSVLKVFEASVRKKSNKQKHHVQDDTLSLSSDESNSLIPPGHVKSAKGSIQDLVTTAHGDGPTLTDVPKKREGSPSASRSPELIVHRAPQQYSLRRHRRPHRNDISLALNAGLVSTPRSSSPLHEGENESVNQDQESFIYAFLEDAIKKDKKKKRRMEYHKHEYSRVESERPVTRESRDRDRDRDSDFDQERDRDCDHDHDRERDRDRSHTRDRHRHHHRHRHHYRESHRERERECGTDRSRGRHRDRGSDRGHNSFHEHRHQNRRHREEVPSRDTNIATSIDQNVLFETFVKLCSTLSEKAPAQSTPTPAQQQSNAMTEVIRSQSHKSLQCEVEPQDVEQQPVRLRTREPSRDLLNSKNVKESPTRTCIPTTEKCRSQLEKKQSYRSKLDLNESKARQVDSVHRYSESRRQSPNQSRSLIDYNYKRETESRIFRDEVERRDAFRERKSYDDDKRKCCEKTSRSFDVPYREPLYEEGRCRRSTRSEYLRKSFDERKGGRDRRYDAQDRRYDDRRKGYEERESKDHLRSYGRKDRWRCLDRYERGSMASRSEEHLRDRDMIAERERDSGLSVADDDTTTLSGNSGYIRVVKQEISEQREAMEKMMKLWKELMRCFKNLSHNQQSQSNSKVMDSAANMQESAEAQLQLWRECMRRYETVARDVGDTDARLMEEIQKQRSEMNEMANMWQECLQRYRDMNNEFNTLKRQFVNETPTNLPAPTPSTMKPEGVEVEPGRPPNYAISASYPVHPGIPMVNYMRGNGGGPLHQRSHSTVPPAWWPPPVLEPARRCSSPASVHHTPRGSPHDSRRASRDRDRDHDRRRRNKRREDSHYKEKSSKQSARRSDHRHRKR